MRMLPALLAVLVLPIPMAGQGRGGQGFNAIGSPNLSAGWDARLDRSTDRIENLQFIVAGKGFRFRTGPAGIFYQPTATAKGRYEVKATFTLTKSSPEPEGFGLFIGGSGLRGEQQQYTYFLVRQDGRFLIKRRLGSQTPIILDWTEHRAVMRANREGRSTYALSIVVSQDSVRFLSGATEVARQQRGALDADGIVGLRINHNLELDVDGFAITTDSR